MKRYELNGNWYSINELSDMSGILAHTIRDRLRRGYPVEEAIKITSTNDSIKMFSEASYYGDWLGMSTSDLYNIYWSWVVANGYSPATKQGFTRQILQLYPMLKIVPTKQGDQYKRIIRLRN